MDRGDPRNILFAVVSIKNLKYYELDNKEGTFEQHYTNSQFDVFPESFIEVDGCQILIIKYYMVKTC